MLTLDFETDGIVGNPMVNPPKPCGLALLKTDRECDALYITDWELMKSVWLEAMDSKEPLLFQHAPFDLSVGLHWFGGKEPAWEFHADAPWTVERKHIGLATFETDSAWTRPTW